MLTHCDGTLSIGNGIRGSDTGSEMPPMMDLPPGASKRFKALGRRSICVGPAVSGTQVFEVQPFVGPKREVELRSERCHRLSTHSLSSIHHRSSSMSDNISDDSNTETGPAEWFETYSVLHPDDPNYRSPINNPPDLCSSSSTSPARSDASLPVLEEHPVPYTATYFALQVYEVAYGILDYAHITWGFNGRNRFAERNWLAQAARVCKSFMNPALDMLWRELDDLGPLLRLLPDVEHTKVGFYPVKTIVSCISQLGA